MTINFLKTFYYKNYSVFKETRTFLDAYIIYKYLNFEPNIKNYLEIGCFKGSILSLVVEGGNTQQNILIDPVMSRIKKTLPKDMFANTTLIENKSDNVNWNTFPKFDLINVDGTLIQPAPSNDMKNCLKIAHENSLILLNQWWREGMNKSRKILKTNGWTPWLKLDQCEWYSKKTLMPFINDLINTGEITNFARIYKGSEDDDCLWRISAPQALYDNVRLIENYIK